MIFHLQLKLVLKTYIHTCIWINSNMLKLNKDKTKFIVFSSKQNVKETENRRIKIGSSYINGSMSVRNVRIILDNTLGMEKQVNFICKPWYYQIRNIRFIHEYINDKTCKTLFQALIISRLDYGNPLLYNVPLLQEVHNCSASLTLYGPFCECV